MILQERLAPLPAIAYQKPTGKPTPSLTIPGQAVNLKYAMEQYKRGTLIERVTGFYEQEGMEIPDLARMTRIERLQLLAEYRKQRQDSETKLNNLVKQQKDEMAKHEKQKQAEGKSQKDDTDKPDAK